jgi:diguanylate cyclase (GGDEF)-like protein
MSAHQPYPSIEINLMLKYWYKEFPNYTEQNRDYWRVKFIFHCLLLISCFFFIIGSINLVYFSDIWVTLLDFGGFVLTLACYLWFRISGNVRLACGALSLLTTALILLFIFIVDGYAHSIIWATLIPPFTFFMVGRKWGTIYSVAALTFVCFIVYQQTQNPTPITYGFGSFLNVVEVSTAFILLYRYYEKSRSSAYQQLAEQTDEVTKLAQTDKLTGLYNRTKFDTSLSEILAQADAVHPVSLLVIDVDNFKTINDTYGHIKGDEVLVALSRRLQQHTREGDLLARWGGEEFALLLPNTQQGISVKVAEKLRRAIEATTIVNMAITVSIGVTTTTKSIPSVDYIKTADAALYKAKLAGRNQVVVVKG